MYFFVFFVKKKIKAHENHFDSPKVSNSIQINEPLKELIRVYNKNHDVVSNEKIIYLILSCVQKSCTFTVDSVSKSEELELNSLLPLIKKNLNKISFWHLW